MPPRISSLSAAPAKGGPPVLSTVEVFWEAEMTAEKSVCHPPEGLSSKLLGIRSFVSYHHTRLGDKVFHITSFLFLLGQPKILYPCFKRVDSRAGSRIYKKHVW